MGENIEWIPPFRKYRFEKKRLETFENWEGPVAKEDLARWGFVYSGVKNYTKCVFCGISLGCWREGDDPRDVHFNYWKHCPLITGCITANITKDSKVSFEDISQ